MSKLLIMGEALVEIMREGEDIELYTPAYFKGPYPSGAPAICASAAARMGCPTALISGVGKDDFGKCLLDRMKELNIDISHVITNPQIATACAFVTYFSDGSRKFIFHMGNTPAVEAKAPKAEDFPNIEIMHIMGCSLMAKKEFALEILKAMHEFKSAKAKISFDPNIRTELMTDESIYNIIEEVMQNTSFFLPGRDELLSISKKDNIEDAIEHCFNYPNMEIILLKNGSKGSTLYKKGAKPKSYPAYKVTQLDATGAGDCFDGAFLAELIKGSDIDSAVSAASAAGALNAAAFGPMEGDISPESIKKLISEQSN